MKSLLAYANETVFPLQELQSACQGIAHAASGVPRVFRVGTEKPQID